jgi:hypothetical protein
LSSDAVQDSETLVPVEPICTSKVGVVGGVVSRHRDVVACTDAGSETFPATSLASTVKV